VNDPVTGGWRWDPSLYAGSAAFYVRGRVSYPAALIDTIVDELALDGHGPLLDLGCGPGSLTLPLASHFDHAVGVDADDQMLGEAQRQASAAGIGNISWLHSRAEDVSPDLGPFRVVTMAQSFHWMDKPRVATLLARLLSPGGDRGGHGAGAVAYVHATTHQGVDGAEHLQHPTPPRARIDELVAAFLGPGRRAGIGYRPVDRVGEQERGRSDAQVFQAAGFTGPVHRTVPGRVVHRSADEVVASVFSLSYATPHLFDDRVAQFEQELRALLRDASPTGRFSEQLREIAVEFWRR
jgi:SAM-dependent methyltransferase